VGGSILNDGHGIGICRTRGQMWNVFEHVRRMPQEVLLALVDGFFAEECW